MKTLGDRLDEIKKAYIPKLRWTDNIDEQKYAANLRKLGQDIIDDVNAVMKEHEEGT